MIPITAALLAGGKSTRMGLDKCRREFDGVPLWRRQLDVLAPLASDLMVVAPALPAWCPPRARWIADAAPDRGSLGPLGGLTAALAATPHDRVLVLAVDLPGMTSGYLETLVARSTPARGVVPMIDGLFQPLSAIYPRTAHAAAAAHLALPDRSLQTLLRGLVTAGTMLIAPVPEPDRSRFRNLNTAQD